MSDFSDEDRRILAYLHGRVARGERYFRSKNIADQIGLSAKQVGARLRKLADRGEDDEDVEIEIEKWSRARSTTWRVEPN